jgi:predicted membrane-bound spermidine synthase/Na+-translocating ferredoxin:NAD+ oxidoreductase RnfG subunit
MRFARGLLILSYGLFSIAAQTLLFREFITTFEGNDISVGTFFSSWFLWVGLGALIVYRAKTFADRLLDNIEFLFLAYLPAFILQVIVIIQAREIAGVESYGLWSIRDILLVSVIVNAPVSVITGMLFPVVCRWVEKNTKRGGGELSISNVYILEAAGSFIGGIGITILLGIGVSLAEAFFIIAFILSGSVFIVQLISSLTRGWTMGRKSWAKITAPAFSFLVCFAICFCFIVGADKNLMNHVRVLKWTKLLPKEALSGSFQTAQAEYLYGVYNGQWVAVREGSVAEALPDKSAAGRIAAIGLCQKPDAENVLVVGSGLALCQGLLQLPQIENVTWAHCDSEYIQKVNKFIPPEHAINDRRLHPLAGDIRSLLAEKQQLFDIVFLNLPEATSSVLNRYYTLEFYRQVKECLSPAGVLAVRIAGGENIMGTELINLGASTKLTLKKVFSHLVLKPGEDTWFIASDSEGLTSEPGTLRDRFATIGGSEKIFTPEALFSVYLPDRAKAAMENYSHADLPQRLLINRDSRPLAHLYSLLLTAKQSGAPITMFIKYLTLTGLVAFVIPLFVLISLRLVYVSSAMNGGLKNEGRESSFDSSFLVFSTGWVGIGVTIVLMYLYQTRFGSLYLHIGIISSLFMVGLTIGALIISRILLRSQRHEWPLFVVMFVHVLILITIAFYYAESTQGGRLIFAAAFVICGLCTGCYFPIAAHQLAGIGLETGRAGGKLEMADHIGASAGGFATSLLLVPVLGAKVTLFLFAIFILTNASPAILKMFKREKAYLIDTTAFKLRGIGYILFGISVSIILYSNLFANAAARLKPSLPERSAQALVGESLLEQHTIVLSDSAKKINYYRVYDVNDKPAGYVFSSEDLAPEVRGYGGKLNLAIYVGEPDGELLGINIIKSNETPSYFELLDKWHDSLIRHRLFQDKPLAEVQAVTGATISSEAVLSALRTSGRNFAEQVLGKSAQAVVEEGSKWAGYLPDASGAYLIGTFILALIVTYYGGFWSRLIVLILTLVFGGIILNAQYSSEQIATLLSFQAPAVGLTGVFMLILGIPLLVVIFGNIYCGYICPFGALQELISYILPNKFKHSVSSESIQKARFIKYVVLFAFVFIFFVSRNRTTLAADPLISIFNLRFTIDDLKSVMLLVVAAALGGSIFYTRFWCRYLCPAGAFLSLLNHVAILKRYMPVKKFGKCEFGLTAKDNMDCIQCDRCRFGKSERKVVRVKEDKKAPVLMVTSLVVAIFVSGISINRFLQVIPVMREYSTTIAPSGGQPRTVDMQRIKTLIEQKSLSDKEAEYYKKIE